MGAATSLQARLNHPLRGVGFYQPRRGDFCARESPWDHFRHYHHLLSHPIERRRNHRGAVAEGIDASGCPEATKTQVTRIARNTAKLLDGTLHIPDEAFILDERFYAGIYVMPDDGTIAAMKRRDNIPGLLRG
jgi:hypothetical protein